MLNRRKNYFERKISKFNGKNIEIYIHTRKHTLMYVCVCIYNGNPMRLFTEFFL